MTATSSIHHHYPLDASPIFICCTLKNHRPSLGCYVHRQTFCFLWDHSSIGSRGRLPITRPGAAYTTKSQKTLLVNRSPGKCRVHQLHRKCRTRAPNSRKHTRVVHVGLHEYQMNYRSATAEVWFKWVLNKCSYLDCIGLTS